MDDLISRAAAIDAAEKLLVGVKGIEEQAITENNVNYICAEIAKLPAVQPMRKEAKWKTAYLDHESMGRRPKILYCSRCNQCAAYPTDFCPACGADMRGNINE